MMQRQNPAMRQGTNYLLQFRRERQTLSMRGKVPPELERHLVEQERQDRRRRNA